MNSKNEEQRKWSHMTLYRDRRREKANLGDEKAIAMIQNESEVSKEWRNNHKENNTDYKKTYRKKRKIKAEAGNESAKQIIEYEREGSKERMQKSRAKKKKAEEERMEGIRVQERNAERIAKIAANSITIFRINSESGLQALIIHNWHKASWDIPFYMWKTFSEFQIECVKCFDSYLM
jgi:hypothetical protein